MPAMVSTTGMPCRSANFASVSAAKRIMHAAAGDDQRTLGVLDAIGGGDDLAAVGPGPPDVVHARLEESAGKVVGEALNVLRQAQKCRAAIARIEHAWRSRPEETG